jgi:hypothetical protein
VITFSLIGSIIGFSFKGEPREPFKKVIDTLKANGGKIPIVSVCRNNTPAEDYILTDVHFAQGGHSFCVGRRKRQYRQQILCSRFVGALSFIAQSLVLTIFFFARRAGFFDGSQTGSSPLPRKTSSRRPFRPTVRLLPLTHPDFTIRRLSSYVIIYRDIQNKYQLNLPDYPGSVSISTPPTALLIPLIIG